MVKGGSNLKTPEGRREYQRRYYQLHKDKAKEYQKQYNLGKRSSTTRGTSNGKIRKKVPYTREVRKRSYSGQSLQHLTVNKFAEVVNMITNFEVIYTGV